MDYQKFLSNKQHSANEYGFDVSFVPGMMFDFQEHLLSWSLKKGRSAIFADCGLGKTIIELAWAKNVADYGNGKVLILSPLAVGPQMVREGEKFDIECQISRDGKPAKSQITVTNYQQLHKFNTSDFVGVVCDESSILKNFDGATKKLVTEFMRTMPYRLLCTATAAPNDYIELGTSSEALGEMGFADMLSRFFKKFQATKSRSEEYRSGLYVFRGYAEEFFWRWVVSWARAIRKPSELGFSDDGFDLPPIHINEHVVIAKTLREGFLFDMPAISLQEQREERRRTITERCELAAALINANGSDVASTAWCYLNDEGDLLAKLIPGSVQVAGADSDEHKESVFEDFAMGNIQTIVTKPTLAGFGLNWQHCTHQTFFPSHSYEQWYQCMRRMWRFGQTKEVTVDVIASEGEAGVVKNMRRKEEAASKMFSNLVELMHNELTIKRIIPQKTKAELPKWIQ